MNLKKTILSLLGRDALKQIIEDLEIEGTDRRSVEDMAATLSRSRRATPETLLETLSEVEVKQVCELVGVQSTGRRGELIKRLLKQDRRQHETASRGRGNTKSRSALKADLKNPQRGKKSTMATEETKTDSGNTKGFSQEPFEQPIRLPEPPLGMLRVTRTELVWPGKYNEDGTLKEVPRVNLPFQVIERVNESRATREAKKERHPTLFDIWERSEGDTFETGWRNKLIWGDNLLVMGSLLEQFAGKVDLIYIDPPFATGSNFSFMTQIGEEGNEVLKEQSIIEEKAYRDTWGSGLSSWLGMILPRIHLIKYLLSDRGSFYLHVDYRVAFHLRLLLDEVFGSECFQNQIVWHYSGWNRHGQKYFNRRHDQIFYYSKGPNPSFNSFSIPWESKEEYVRIRKQKILVDKSGREYVLSDAGGGERVKRFLDEAIADGRPADDVWNIDKINNSSREALGYETQKPEVLLERLIIASSSPGDLIADFFCGSGTTLATAEKIGRRWIGCDLGRWAIHVTRKRLLGIENCKPFEVLNLGKYERQYWQGATFGKGKDAPLVEQALYEYLAFILRLYGGQPVPGLMHLHGKRGRAMIHIGAVDAPVTIDEITQAIEECARLKQPELHVLGWEWEMGLAGPNNEYRKGGLMQEVAREKGVKLLLFQIPREVMEQQAVDKGDIQFFELAYLEVEIKQPQKLTAVVRLVDFVIPNTELIPDDVRSKIKKWSDYIDYWSIDWDFQNDTFMQGWVAYRTRKERTLALISDPHTYEKPGKYKILIKVIDIFGNDTSQAHTVEVK